MYPEVLCESEVVLTEICFLAPVSFFVQGRNVCGAAIPPFSRNLPILTFVLGVSENLEQLQKTGIFKMPLPLGGYLFLEQKEEQVEVYTDHCRDGLFATVDELKQAFREYANQVKREFETHCSAMMKHPNWSIWFGGPEGLGQFRFLR